MISSIDLTQMESADRFRVYAVADRSALGSLIDENYRAKYFFAVDDLIAIIDPLPTEMNQAVASANQLNLFSEHILGLHRIADILPFRFASAIPLHELSALLQSRYEFYKTNLQNVAGCTEVNARWAIQEDASIAALAESEKPLSGSGRDYLRSKQRASMHHRKLETDLKELAAEIGCRLGVSCVDTHTSRRAMDDTAHNLQFNNHASTQASGPSTTRQITIAGLEVMLRREHAQQYLQALTQARFHDRLPTITSGPWPPYSFIADFNVAFTTAPIPALASPKPVQRCAISAQGKTGS